ncbi:F-box protein At3g60790 [Linum perenne]
MKEKQPKTISPTVAGDRISTIPDELIHKILGQLRSKKAVTQTSILSKRWTQLFRSYPILEFEEEYIYYFSCRSLIESQERLLAATVDTFSIITMSAVRVQMVQCAKSYICLLDRILDLALAAAEFSLEEIDIKFGHGRDYYSVDYQIILYSIPRSFFSTSKQFLRLTVLKLSDCKFDLYSKDCNFSCLGSSLKVLYLENVYFPDVTILNSMISGASLLETLTLEDDIDFGNDDDKVQRFQIRNHPCLKLVDASDLSNFKGFEITGAPSLVQVRLPYIGYLDDFQISMTPNLKLLYMKGT